MPKLIWIIGCAALVGGSAEAGAPAEAAVAVTEDETEVSPDMKAEPKKWYDKLSFSGDFRLRYEGFNWKGHFDNGRRDRLRYRLRFGFRGQVLDNLALGFQLRSGNPKNPISDNQSFDDSFSKTPISIAEAYVDWQAANTLEIIVGQFSPTKLWRAADIQWDDDVTIEGAMELFAWKAGGLLKELDLNLYQFVLNESGDSIDSYMLGGQIVPVFDLGEKNDLALGAGFEAISSPEKVATLYFEDALVIDSGYVTNLVNPNTGEMVSDFRVGSLFLEWQNKSIEAWPIKVSLYFYKNFGAGRRAGRHPAGGRHRAAGARPGHRQRHRVVRPNPGGRLQEAWPGRATGLAIRLPAGRDLFRLRAVGHPTRVQPGRVSRGPPRRDAEEGLHHRDVLPHRLDHR